MMFVLMLLRCFRSVANDIHFNNAFSTMVLVLPFHALTPTIISLNKSWWYTYHALCVSMWCYLSVHQDVVNSGAVSGAILGGGCRCRSCAPPSPAEMTCGFLIYLVFWKEKKRHQSATPFLSDAPPPKKNPGAAPAFDY